MNYKEALSKVRLSMLFLSECLNLDIFTLFKLGLTLTCAVDKSLFYLMAVAQTTKSSI